MPIEMTQYAKESAIYSNYMENSNPHLFLIKGCYNGSFRQTTNKDT